jgi:hypothetical protein
VISQKFFIFTIHDIVRWRKINFMRSADDTEPAIAFPLIGQKEGGSCQRVVNFVILANVKQIWGQLSLWVNRPSVE